MFGHKDKLLFRLWSQGLVKILKMKLLRDFEDEVWSVFYCWCLVGVTMLNLGQDFRFKFIRDTDEILKLMLNRDSEIEIWWTFVQELVIWTQSSGPLCLWQCYFWALTDVTLTDCWRYQIKYWGTVKPTESTFSNWFGKHYAAPESVVILEMFLLLAGCTL